MNLDSLEDEHNDYIYIEVTRFDRGFYDTENYGIMTLNTEKENFTYDITKWIYDILERLYFDVPDFVHVKTYSRQERITWLVDVRILGHAMYDNLTIK